jgi:hypothetical protein
MPDPSKYVLPVTNFTARTTGVRREPAPVETWHAPAVDNPLWPTRITFYAFSLPDAVTKAHAYLSLLHARRAWEDFDALPPTATDVIYAAARRRATNLTPHQRAAESEYADLDTRHPAETSALHDAMREHDELT